MPSQAKIRAFLVASLVLFSTGLRGNQDLEQTIRGKVVDRNTRTPLIGATVILLKSSPLRGTITDERGNFRMENVPVGRQSLKVTYLGYQDALIPNIMVSSGKEVVLDIEMEESVDQLEEVTITAKQHSSTALNQMASLSSNRFSVEETQRYAASILDPARMVQNYAGVTGTDDLGNEIIVRGNTPRGILWRLEGIQIPNPNHFGGMGNTGGGVSMLSSSTLGTSDFYTGAFPAEFGNAISGVFDLRFRSGNSEKREFSVMVGAMGLEASAEGCFKRGNAASYLINYRYSTLELLKPFFSELGDVMPRYQDLSYKFNFPTRRAGTYSVFGLWGRNNEKIPFEKDSTQWYDYVWEDSLVWSYEEAQLVNVVGVTHFMPITKKTWVKSVMASTIDNYYALAYEANPFENYQEELTEDSDFKNYTFTAHVMLNHKFNAKHSLRAGGIYSHYVYKYFQKNNWMDGDLTTYLDDNDAAGLLQAYTQWKYRISGNITLLAGLHYSQFLLNNTFSIEPRGALQWAFHPKHQLSIAMGKHSKPEHPSTYFLEEIDYSGIRTYPNKNLEFITSIQYVLGYDFFINQSMRVKVEAYYQDLSNVPVEKDSSSLESLLNVSDIWDLLGSKPADNSGTGRNLGIDITFNKSLAKGNYFLITASVFDSKYTVRDQTFNTRFNNRYLFNALYGKEWKIGRQKNNVFSVNGKFKLIGGTRYNELDQETIDYYLDLFGGEMDYDVIDYSDLFKQDTRYSGQAPAYWRIDLGVAYKINRPKSTHSIMIDIQNVTNHQNVYSYYFDSNTNSQEAYYHMGIIPVFNYRIEF
jgi:hypothetical protein